jgi:nicotinamidase-related amidase
MSLGAAGEWRTFLPEEERAIYERAGYGGDRGIDGTPALLVVDATRSFTGSRPLPPQQAMEEFSTSCGVHAWTALSSIAELLSAFRARELPVVYTRRDEAAQSATTAATKRVNREPSAEGNGFVELIAPAAGEWICEKARASAFYGTPLDAFLRIRGVRSLVVCGGATSGCVRASCVDAFSAGLNVVVAEDACFDRARHPHLANLFDVHAKYGTVMRTVDVVAQLGRPGGRRAGGAPRRGESG